MKEAPQVNLDVILIFFYHQRLKERGRVNKASYTHLHSFATPVFFVLWQCRLLRADAQHLLFPVTLLHLDGMEKVVPPRVMSFTSHGSDVFKKPILRPSLLWVVTPSTHRRVLDNV